MQKNPKYRNRILLKTTKAIRKERKRAISFLQSSTSKTLTQCAFLAMKNSNNDGTQIATIRTNDQPDETDK